MARPLPSTYHPLVGTDDFEPNQSIRDKPRRVGEKLRAFLNQHGKCGLQEKDRYPRALATNVICKYIRDQKLQSLEDKRVILPDATLRELLDYPQKADDPPLMYFRLGTLISGLFLSDSPKKGGKGDGTPS